jgi:NAD-dependent DNA ligase
MANEFNGFRAQLRAFVDAHPHGWNHLDWLELLAGLTDSGVDTTNPDQIGTALEQERVLACLEGLEIKGLGPKRREALAAHFGGLWNLEHASADDIAQVPSFHPALAKAIHKALR